ncbi:hypothetical protein HH212_19330 [Massilia forsythiae]|uniref:Uncharacterized protein n=1 Tax=Massilia forsythiae TaxID=2728020 RepID=A0A7Z2VYS9_9BURK|nr:hypothetical protein [Massilia forsythiae]QJE01906.1 hypothetical protein HH212_19330 [Massilia forsythiae]
MYHAAPLDLMGRFVTDPKLVGGVRVTPFLGVETGYASLVDRGTVFVDYRRADGITARQGTTGFSSYLAGTATLPLERGLEAYGKLGVSFSEFNHHELGPVPRPGSFRETDTGAYATAGASYRPSDKATLSGAFERHGDSAKWGANTSSNGLKAKLKLGF